MDEEEAKLLEEEEEEKEGEVEAETKKETRNSGGYNGHVE